MPMNVDEARRRLESLRARRRAEDERLVCLERAQILAAARDQYGHLPRVEQQARVVCDLCEQISVVIEPEDLLLGRMPEVVPTEAEEQFIAQHPELFVEPGVPGLLDSMSIYVPDWDWLVARGLGGIIAEARTELERVTGPADEARAQREFLQAAISGLESLAGLVRRYAALARQEAERTECPERRAELQEAATRCERVAEQPPATFLEALQLLQITHMALSCLVGGRDVTPGWLDQVLGPLYAQDVAEGLLSREDAVVLLAQFMLRLSQMAGSGTDEEDNRRRSPCQFAHLYVTVGGADEQGRPAANELTAVIVDAIDLLAYKEPTLLVRWRADMDEGLRRRVAELASRGRPVTIYNDEMVVAALVTQGVPLEWARGYVHSACHNVLVAGHEAASGPAGFYNVPQMLLDVIGNSDPPTFEALMAALRGRMREVLAGARAWAATRWSDQLASACPLLQSALMRESIAAHRPNWQAASISHYNHHFVSPGTVVDALIAIRRLVFEEQRLSLPELRGILADNWVGHEDLRAEIRRRFPRYGQDCPQTRALAAEVGRMWVEEVEAASRGLDRLAMWPGFYTYMAHVRPGRLTGATPDGRAEGEPLSAGLGPSAGTPPCSLTAILQTMAALPFTHTPSGAGALTLPVSANGGAPDPDRTRELIDTYFALGGLHLHLNVLTAQTVLAALQSPAEHEDLMVRVAGFSAVYVHLHPDMQQDILRRAQAGELAQA